MTNWALLFLCWTKTPDPNTPRQRGLVTINSSFSSNSFTFIAWFISNFSLAVLQNSSYVSSRKWFFRKLTPELSIFGESLFARWNYLCQKNIATHADYIQEGRAEAETNEAGSQPVYLSVWDKVKGDRWFILDTSGHWIINNNDDPSLSHHKYMKPVFQFSFKFSPVKMLHQQLHPRRKRSESLSYELFKYIVQMRVVFSVFQEVIYWSEQSYYCISRVLFTHKTVVRFKCVCGQTGVTPVTCDSVTSWQSGYGRALRLSRDAWPEDVTLLVTNQARTTLHSHKSQHNPG